MKRAFSNDMLKQIRLWISQDKMVITANNQLKELRAKYRTALQEYRRADLDLFYKTARSMKKVDWRLSLPDRRKELEACSVKHIKALRDLFFTTRRKLKKLKTQMELAALAIGHWPSPRLPAWPLRAEVGGHGPTRTHPPGTPERTTT